MPYYPEDQSDENLNKLRRKNVCAECGRRLYIYLDMEDGRFYLGCTTLGHEGIAREYQPSTSRSRRDNSIRRLMELEQSHGPETTTAVAKLPRSGQLSQPQAMHILRLVYPKAPQDEIVRCAILCQDFGLHPLMKEVYLIPFNEGKSNESWATVIGIGASRKMAADKKGAYSFLDDTPRAATQEEVAKQYGKDSEEEKDNLISICRVKGEKGNEALGFGLWPKSKIPYGTDKGNTKRNMANIHSERQALDRLPGEALPQVQVIDEAYAELPDVGKVNLKTGEVIEGEAKVVSEESEQEGKPKDSPPKEIDMSPLEHVGALMTRCQNYGISKEDVLRVAGKVSGSEVDHPTKITDPNKVWTQIVDTLLKPVRNL